MTTWVQILADLRTDMDDNPLSPKLSADQAFLYAKLAIRDYSTWNPRILTGTLDLDDDGKATLPTDLISIIEVRDGNNDLVLPLVGVTNPPDYTLVVSQYRWWIEGRTFRVNTWSDLPDTVTVLYRGYHALPTSASDSTTAMTFPDADEEAILLYIRAKKAGSVRSKTSRADRYKRRVDAGNTRTDNPLRPETDDLADAYWTFMNERYGSSGAVSLVRQRR